MVKFDIISGFLGSGKTTLIQRILKVLKDSNEKIVLIENEFGSVNVDREILAIEGFELYEISHGCVCCKLKGDFIITLQQILSQKVDRIIFEPSGIFIIDEIFALFKDPLIASKCLINSITTVVDGQNFTNHIQSYAGFFKSQICNASSLVVSKTQFLSAEEISLLELELRLLNEKANILTKNWGDLSSEEIKNLVERKTVSPVNKITHPTSHGFESMGLRTSKTFALKQLENFLERCQKGDYGNIIRGKGFIKSDNRILEFQYIDKHYSISESTSVTAGIVSFIGTDLSTDLLTEEFQEDICRIFTTDKGKQS